MRLYVDVTDLLFYLVSDCGVAWLEVVDFKGNIHWFGKYYTDKCCLYEHTRLS